MDAKALAGRANIRRGTVHVDVIKRLVAMKSAAAFPAAR
jgi:hypothetical protein